MASKIFNLRCDRDHAFEGWFDSPEAIEAQRARGLLECPVCASREVRRLPSAPYVHTAGATAGPVGGPPAPVAAALPTPAQWQAMMLRVAREIAARTEDVGPRFAEEARRIHYREAPERGIRGVATPAEAEALHDEGIAVLPLPMGEAVKEPLQ